MSQKFGSTLVLESRLLLFSGPSTMTLTNTDAVVRLAGFTSSDDLIGMTGGVDGRIMFLVCASRTIAMDIVGESLSATAADRFADTHTIDPDTAAGFVYDGSISRWTKFL